MDKASYSLTDNFLITLRLENIGGDCVHVVNRRFAFKSDLESEGEIQWFFSAYPGNIQRSWPESQDRMALLSDMSFLVLFNNESFQSTQFIPYQVKDLCDVGTCYIQAVYDNQADVLDQELWGDFQVWKGLLASNVVRIIVRQ